MKQLDCSPALQWYRNWNNDLRQYLIDWKVKLRKGGQISIQTPTWTDTLWVSLLISFCYWQHKH